VPSPLKTRREFCKLLKVSMTTLDKMIAEGKIKAFKVGGKSVRIHEDQLKSILSN
jgi:excisionase family DNA binding protein